MKYRALIALLITAALWGISGSVIKKTVQIVPPFTFLTLRMLIATMVCAPVIVARGGFKKIGKSGFAKAILLALLGQTICLSLGFFGYQRTSAVEGTIIDSTFPILVAIAGAVILKEEITISERKGIIITTLGTFLILASDLIFYKQNGLRDNQHFQGNILMILANISWLAYILLEKKRVKDGKREGFKLEVTFFSFIVAFFTLAPLAVIETITYQENLLSRALSNPSALLGILYMGIFASVGAYTLYNYGLSQIEASETAIFSYLQPFFAVPFAFILLGETPKISMIPGAMLIFTGFYLHQKGKSRRKTII